MSEPIQSGNPLCAAIKPSMHVAHTIVVTIVSVSGGNRDSGGGFNNLGNNGNWWSSSDAGSGNAWNRNLNYNNANANRNNNDHRNGFSVRCARDWGNAATVRP
jgi:uncharacterized protein (TIGR02145 family)